MKKINVKIPKFIESMTPKEAYIHGWNAGHSNSLSKERAKLEAKAKEVPYIIFEEDER